MREPTCMMQPITYTSIMSAREPTKENPIQALSHSVSFGRFVSESLAWERWSIFSSKRYVEEAERFSQPGSVAQKKAFFEAHYQRMAGKKHKADLLDQLDAAVEEKPDNNHEETRNINETKSNEGVIDVAVAESSPVLETTKIEPEEKPGEMKSGEMKSVVPRSGGSESSQDALMPKIKEEQEADSPRKRKSTITWLMPVCVSPAIISSKYRSSIAKSEKKTPKSPVAVAETKSGPKRFFLAAKFSKFWSKCRKRLLCSISCRLGSKDKAARRNKEKVGKTPKTEKTQSKWFDCLCFNTGSGWTDHKEKGRSDDRKKRMAITCPKLCSK